MAQAIFIGVMFETMLYKAKKFCLAKNSLFYYALTYAKITQVLDRFKRFFADST